ncbi:lipoprotein insertase outer membrane protein LolB [Pseudazoarcus pumilus]|uniref:Outer-membrane lipoprotein LolB n=1 Tax=Pseudazoarcus pumilus TaxID=2067960 RepID=A0A2I6S4X7_9RHOO|nr:lipoprotein insertase outer membrane protein LolB [Pseudazoarcus pumilus]AUN94316.1 outer membrane lipoprotein LolB [Pseudazoarcus pumilus]
MVSARRALAVSVALLALAGCALQPAGEDGAPLVERAAIEHFEFEGRIAASDGQRAANGTLQWTRRAGYDEWTLLSPLGQIVARVVGTPQGATLRTADGRTIEAVDVDELLPQMLGVDAPADHLDEWLQARPAPGARVIETDALGRPTRISDSGWLIDYPTYADDSAEAMPRRIDATWGEVRLRVVTDGWTALP